MKLFVKIVMSLVVIGSFIFTPVFGQSSNFEFHKISQDSISWFENKYDHVVWTGEGLSKVTEVDSRQTNMLRARLQTLYGDPTKTVEDLFGNEDFDAGQAIQFEYWFMVNDSIPMVILDIDGPFRRGLVFGGYSKFEDSLPKIKKDFSLELLKLEREDLDPYQDYYLSTERNSWYNVKFQNGRPRTIEIDKPAKFN